ncbi:MAG: glutaredoxin family protein [Woeseiaceae bacterium]
MRTLTLYSREACHLCELLIEAVLPLIRGRAGLEIVDIDSEENLRQQFDRRVPVLCDGERVICEAVFDRRALLSWLTETDL